MTVLGNFRGFRRRFTLHGESNVETLTFVVDSLIQTSTGNFLTDGHLVGSTVEVVGSASNDGYHGTILALGDVEIELAGDGEPLVAEAGVVATVLSYPMDIDAYETWPVAKVRSGGFDNTITGFPNTYSGTKMTITCNAGAADTPATYASGGGGNVTFANASPATITRDNGDWTADGFSGSTSPGEAPWTITIRDSVSNDGTYRIQSLTATVITLHIDESLAAEVLLEATLVAVGYYDQYVWYLSQRTEDPARQLLAINHPVPVGDTHYSGSVEIYHTPFAETGLAVDLTATVPWTGDVVRELFKDCHLYVMRNDSTKPIQWVDLLLGLVGEYS